ncbi:MAG: hypothetical protein JWO71_1698 [Candidatus Acidoferrum typicum]|nr:hypothetical protein [Candidatus Acidoferrum typicum]
MLCDKYKGALIDAAASGAALPSYIREHVDLCVRCQGVLAARQVVFAAVDMGLHKISNVELPSSFLPDLKSKLVAETPSTRAGIHNWAFVCAAGTLVLALALIGLPRDQGKQIGGESLNRTKKARALANGLRLDPIHVSKAPDRIEVSKARMPQNLSVTNHDPEVLVPREEEEYLEGYYAKLQKRGGMNLILAGRQEVQAKALQIEQIEVKELKIESLDEQAGLQRTNTR